MEKDSRSVDARTDLTFTSGHEIQHALIERDMARIHLDEHIRRAARGRREQRGDVEKAAQKFFGAAFGLDSEPRELGGDRAVLTKAVDLRLVQGIACKAGLRIEANVNRAEHLIAVTGLYRDR